MKYASVKALLRKRFHLPQERSLGRAIRNFSLAEKTVFYFFVLIFTISGLTLLYRVNSSFLTEIPARGGTLTEGIVGNPRFINPVLAFSEADKSLSSIIYSGLLKRDPAGNIKNDLAESVKTSPDGLKYGVKLRDDALFQDGSAITADDIVFTINKITDPSIKSPLYGDWSGVTIEKIDDKTVNFTLKKPYPSFLSNLTLGILPKNIWKNVSDDEFSFSQFDTLPVGSGPFKISSVERNSGGIPDYYDLVPFDKAIGGSPYIGHLIFRFYPSEKNLLDAYSSGEIDSVSGISPEAAGGLKKKDSIILSSPLPRIFGVFFNQSQNKALAERSVREALDLSAPKGAIIRDVLGGYATVIDSPLPPGFIGETMPAPADIARAQALLSKAGWTKNGNTGILEKKSKKDTITLSFTISTGATPELSAVAEMLKNAWSELGAKVDVQVFETGELNNNVIRPRRFQALLFGEVVGADPDLYSFWHSSQRNDPGLNIAMYANSKVDKALEDVRKTSDSSARERDYKIFLSEINNDVPTVFLYSPNFIYVLPRSVHAVTLGNLGNPEDRFASIRNWYMATDRVWNIFVK